MTIDKCVLSLLGCAWQAKRSPRFPTGVSMGNFFPAPASINSLPLASAKKTASAHGVVVLRVIAGLMLLEASPSKAAA